MPDVLEKGYTDEEISDEVDRKRKYCVVALDNDVTPQDTQDMGKKRHPHLKDYTLGRHKSGAPFENRCGHKPPDD